MSEMVRKEGWYHVKCKSGAWGCAYWDECVWRFFNHVDREDLLVEIGPRIPTPDEPWQCVPKEPTIKMVAELGFDGDIDLCIGHGAISEEIFNQYAAMLASAPSPDDTP